jgi:hypothetical protein
MQTKPPISRRTSPPKRRGRPTKGDCVSRIVPLIRADVMTLDECSFIASYPGVHALLRLNQRQIFPLGVSLRLLLDRAVADALTLATTMSNAQQYHRMATFLQLWYAEERTVTQVAKTLGLERTHVAKTIQRPALQLVASRFLMLAELSDPLGGNDQIPVDLQSIRRIIA